MERRRESGAGRRDLKKGIRKSLTEKATLEGSKRMRTAFQAEETASAKALRLYLALDMPREQQGRPVSVEQSEQGGQQEMKAEVAGDRMQNI